MRSVVALALTVGVAAEWTKLTNDKGQDGACASSNDGPEIPAVASGLEADLVGCQEACASGIFGDCGGISHEKGCPGTQCDCILDVPTDKP